MPVIGEIGPGMAGDYMTYDQRFASQRPDVLVYQTEPLDRDVTIAGPVTPILRVSTTGTDSDFVVKLIDVYPNDYPDPNPEPEGRAHGRLSATGARRADSAASFATASQSPSRSSPASARRSNSSCRTSATLSAPGHRIMVQIQSSWFPLVDRNPQKFLTSRRRRPRIFRRPRKAFTGAAKKVPLCASSYFRSSG